MKKEMVPYNDHQKFRSDEVQNVLSKLSPDEQMMLGDILKDCTREMTLYRGLPFAALSIGSLYLARKRLPPALHFGPKGWPFYIVVGIGAITTANVLSIPKCTQRIQPTMEMFMKKYSSEETSSTTNIDRRGREGSSASQYTLTKPEVPIGSPSSASLTSSPELMEPVTLKTDEWTNLQPKSKFIYDQPSYMSGTPVGPAKKSSYGDEGFS